MRNYFFYSSIILLFYLTSCTKDKSSPIISIQACDTILFSKTVFPIFQANCNLSGCHDNITAANGFTFDSYEGIKAPSPQQLLGAINHQVGYVFMPLDKPQLPPEEIKKIECWVKSGRVNN